MQIQKPLQPYTEDDARALAKMPAVEAADGLAFNNPPRSMQESFVGASFDEAYGVAASFLNHLLQHLPVQVDKVLDFGCGWGRMLRLLRRHPGLTGVEMHGCDLSLEALDMNRRTLPNVWFTPTTKFPPSAYREGMFDVVYAYSVFSHLSPKSHDAWAAEFARVLRSGGRAIVTTQPSSFFQLCQDFRFGKHPISSKWHERLAQSFTDQDCEERYNRGEFLYQAGIGDPETYGEAVVPEQYFREAWGKVGFELIDWNTTGQQNWAVLERR